MPWNKDGGGGWQGGGSKGPWGQGPGPSGGNRGPTPPDLDELIKRGQDSLKNFLPTGGRGTWLIPLVLLLAFASLAVFTAPGAATITDEDELVPDAVVAVALRLWLPSDSAAVV